MYYKLTQIAANWWIEQMKRRCCLSCPANVIYDNAGFVIVNDFLAEEFCRFEKILFEQIYSTIKSEHYLNLFCYYYPCTELLDLAKRANISTAYFPVKAQMIVDENSIKVSTDVIEFYTLHFCNSNL